MLYILALPLLILLSFKQKYRDSLPSRFFLYKNPSFSKDGGIHFHVCSLGEARALKAIFDAIKRDDIKITTITQTGYSEAKKYKAEVRYLPFEIFLPFWLKKSDILVVLEAEFWYMLFLVAKLQGSKVILLNGRISQNSREKYLKFKWFYQKILSNVDIVFAQSSEDRDSFLALGAKKIEVIGNIKLSNEIQKSKEYKKPHCEVIVAASTHDGEEELILKAFLEYKKDHNSKLFVVPRHPERFEKVCALIAQYIQSSTLTLSRFSNSIEFDSDIILVDAMGELNNIYAISDIAILGGAFRDDVGGHNPLEAAFFGCKLISGEHFFHQKELFRYVDNVQIVTNDKILDALREAKNIKPSRVTQSCDLSLVIKELREN